MADNHYNSEYFAYQISCGEFGGIANKELVEDYIKPSDVVLDFGCGGGFLLKNLTCNRRVGIEINDTARMTAESNGIEAYKYLNLIQDNYVDVVISVHAIEHTHNPLNELKNINRVLKKGGKAIIIVPCEHINRKYYKDNIHQHLFTWNPMCLGNLMTVAGFEVIESKPYYDRWFGRLHVPLLRIFGFKTYRKLCKINGRIGSLFQVRAIAEKN